jgi:hypothetical protein
MYQALRRENFELPMEENYMFEYCPTANYENYENWDKLFKKIISI